ncbi:H-NS histone family protein [Rhodoferax sp. OV413]|uniref:H-NS histone family protein n=1 Tax=Rhodoferax sp. OV413 TaxID=1855285 RepID=UPI0008846219|nr:H-NS histone family protein [Rhodoferax sp. OV413]SDP86100.1 H-NS histone family protein [Rhodoferax sp. OV413]
MADDSATQLEKLEAARKKAAEALAEADTKLANFRKENRGPKLVELKKDIENYGFTAAELFGEAALAKAKPNAKGKATKRPLTIVKYKDDSGNTWGGGKGPRPAWVKAIQEAGGDMEKYRVSP